MIQNYNIIFSNSYIKFINFKCIKYIVPFKLIIFVITDAVGIRDIDESTLKKISHQHDVLFIRIADADYTGKNRKYDIEDKQYLPEFFTRNKRLARLEQSIKDELDKNNSDRLIVSYFPKITRTSRPVATYR